MRNIFIETIEKLTGKKVIEEKMSCIHTGTTPMDELVELALRTKEALRKKLKIGKPGKKLAFVHTGMLDADRKLKEKEIKEKVKEIKRARRKASLLLIDNLERKIANLKKQLKG